MRRRGAGIALAVAIAVAVAGCGGPDLTQSRVENAVGPTFANLFARQQSLLGKALPSVPEVSASCHRSGAGEADRGAGDDWICQVLVDRNGPTELLTYELNVKADGCYSADGPTGLVGGRTLTTPTGGTRVNPLFAFDGCFDSW